MPPHPSTQPLLPESPPESEWDRSAGDLRVHDVGSVAKSVLEETLTYDLEYRRGLRIGAGLATGVLHDRAQDELIGGLARHSCERQVHQRGIESA